MDNLYHCGHCDQNLSKRAFYQHKRLYYDRNAKKWSKTRLDYHTTGPTFTLSDASDDETPSETDDFSFEDVRLHQTEGDGYENGEDITCEAFEHVSGQDNGPSLTAELVTEEWSDSEIEPVVNEANDGNTLTPMIHLYTFFLLMFQTVFRLSDKAMNVLFTFFVMFFSAFTRTILSFPHSFITKLPSNVRAARKLATNDRSSFVKYVCCPDCHSIYSWKDSIISLHNGLTESKKCSFQRFPFHPQPQHQRSCGATLMKTVKSPSGKQLLYPRLIYCYRSLLHSLQDLLKEPGFIEKCEAWREDKTPDGTYADIYNGQIWKDFLSVDGAPFLSAPFNYALHLNMDWFQPFKRTQHSEGVIYLSIMNLPRSERFRKENVILVGVIPGPREPELHINTFLQPLVNELMDLWTGVCMYTASGVPVIVRAALLCIGCDIPAARKVCGFLGHRATMGCSKCLLPFPTKCFGDKADYSNFDRSTWEPRTGDNHRVEADKYLHCTTQGERHEIERRVGVRYSCLMQLPYFDAPRMCVIDPMHNLLLGTAKHMVEIWKSTGTLNNKDFDTVQTRVDSFICPSDVGRVPYKISSSFAGFTAEQWKNWTIFFSAFALKGVLPWQQYDCWLLYVKACFLLCRRVITTEQLKEADNYLMEFLQKFVQIFGSESCTMNMHLHGHLKQCVEDYGPVYSFWCFSFERMNGILGSYHTNNHHISVQLARRFLDSKLYAPVHWPKEFVQDFLPLLEQCDYHKGSLMHTTLQTELAKHNPEVSPLPPINEDAFSSLQQQELHALMVSRVDSGTQYRILLLHRQSRAVIIGQEHVLGAETSRHSRSSLVLARHLNNAETGLAIIHFFAECNAVSESDCKHIKAWVAAVSWFMPHDCRVWFGSPSQVWSTVTLPDIVFIPIQSIQSRVVYTKASIDFGRAIGHDTVYVIVPVD